MIKFNRIENGSIYTTDFNPLLQNNEIDFTANEKIAVIYGPNGTGKTSLVKAMSDEKGTNIEFEYEKQRYISGKQIFYIINDQNGRNIIKGETKDFFLGDNIRREYELQELIVSERTKIIGDIITKLKSHGISAASSPLIDLISASDIAALLRDIANSKSKGDKYQNDKLIATLNTIKVAEISEYDQAKLQFIISDISDKNSIIRKVEDINKHSLIPSPHINQIEENSEAIDILNRFHKDQCIVCDTQGIDWETLLTDKTQKRMSILKNLSDNVKSLIERIVDIVPASDPFQIKTALLDDLSKGTNTKIASLLENVQKYIDLFNQLVLNSLAAIFAASELTVIVREYQALIDAKPEISDEDMLYIEEIISNSMGKNLVLARDDNKNLRVLLSNQEFLNISRDELPLSTGEQNFLSLTLEFLKAKNSECPIIVIDDPISSFDSIYKNKVVYAIVKILHNKKRIVLTHNTDLLRLLEGQYKNCYKLYLLNNTDGEENGFIRINRCEQDMLISIEKLLTTFRETIFPYIKEKELFLISMIPFMRGYSNLINNKEIKNDLTKLMHGYMTDEVDVARIYINLFENRNNIFPDTYSISVSDILTKKVDGKHILDNARYPLLDKTLRHSFTYLFLRLSVEKALVDKYGIDTNRYNQLGQIISAAFPEEKDLDQIRNRIQLTSKKTLINDFNHFEGNLSIFQPAIDITDRALEKEKNDIMTFVRNLEENVHG